MFLLSSTSITKQRALIDYLYRFILALFLHPSPPSQWLVRVPLVIMLPQLMQGLPLPYGCNNNVNRRQVLTSPFHYSCFELRQN